MAKPWKSLRLNMAGHHAIGLVWIGATCVPSELVAVYGLGSMRSTMRRRAPVAQRSQVLSRSCLQRTISRCRATCPCIASTNPLYKTIQRCAGCRVDSLLTQLARCCRPVPPDAIAGFVTQGRGVSIHRRSCSTFRSLLERAPERVIQTAWNPLDEAQSGGLTAKHGTQNRSKVFPADLAVTGLDRPELMRELFEGLSRQGVHVIDLRKSVRRGIAQIC